jgi:TrmH family RNA methyltransferase
MNMLSKNELKYIKSLSHKKHRDEEKLFIAEGPKLAEEILKSDFEIKQVYATKEWLRSRATMTVPLTEISEAELTSITNLQTANMVFIIAKQKVKNEEPVLQNHLTLVLDGIQDPGNFGTIIRIANWFGVKQIVASEDSVEVYNPKVVQSTMGSICKVDVWYKDLVQWIEQTNVPVYGALLNGQNIYTVKNIKEGLLIIGNEAKGIREPLKSKITHAVTIPKIGEAESLNAAVATGIIVGWMVSS